MSQYRKKPVVIEARQLTSSAALFEIMDWIDSNGGKAREWCWDDDTEEPLPERYLDIKTPEGVMRASDGDWVIRGVADEFYPCKPDIFAATYEPASLPPEQEAQQPVSMDDAIAAGDGTLHGAIDHWQRRALAVEQTAQGQEPLSAEQIERLFDDSFSAASFCRAVERAHGIGVQLTKEGGGNV